MLGSLIGGGLSLLGGLFGKSAQEEANATNAAMAAENIKLQKQFAQKGIQWKVADAQKAGIHPLYALGASTTSFSPVSVGAVPENALASSLSGMGQNLVRAGMANLAPSERVAAIGSAQQSVANELSIENQTLQNQLLKFRVQQMQAGQIGPGGPEEEKNLLIPGQGNTAGINPEAMKVAPAGSAPSGEAGSITDMGWARTKTGWAPVPSKDVKERIEDNLPQELMHFYRNNILPSLGQNMVNPPFPAPTGQIWWFNTLRQEYQLLPLNQRPLMGHKVEGR